MWVAKTGEPEDDSEPHPTNRVEILPRPFSQRLMSLSNRFLGCRIEPRAERKRFLHKAGLLVIWRCYPPIDCQTEEAQGLDRLFAVTPLFASSRFVLDWSHGSTFLPCRIR